MVINKVKQELNVVSVKTGINLMDLVTEKNMVVLY